MSKQFLSDIDLKKNEIKNAVLHPLSVAPSNPREGQIYYNTTDDNLYRYNGSSWVTYQSTITTSGILSGDGNGNISAASTAEVTTLNIDTAPTSQSSNLVTSGGIYTSLKEKMPDVTFGAKTVTVDTTTVSFSKDGDNDWYISGDNPLSGFTATTNFKDNVLYTVIWDDTEYECFYYKHTFRVYNFSPPDDNVPSGYKNLYCIGCTTEMDYFTPNQIDVPFAILYIYFT